MKATHIIFRIPPVDADIKDQFVEITLDANGNIDSNGIMFTVNEGDSYLQMTPYQIVFAYKETDNSSRDLLWFTIFGPDEKEAVISEIEFTELQNTVRGVFEIEYGLNIPIKSV